MPATRRTSLLALGAGGGLVGLLIGLQALTPEFINGTGGKWVRPENDYNAYLVAWHYYVSDTWRLPLFSLPAMGYPEGGSVLFNDALPLTALPSKVIYQLTGVLINPFGWWILLTYVLQGVMAAKVMLSVGVRSVAASAAAAALAVVRRRSSRGWVTRLSQRIFFCCGRSRLHFSLSANTARSLPSGRLSSR